MMLRIVVLCVVASFAYGMQDLVDLAASLNETQLANLIATAGLTDTLKQQGPFTLIAPTDLAFNAIPSAELNSLLGDTAALSDLIKYHVLQGEIFSWDISSGRILTTLNGHSVRVYKQGNDIYFNNAKAVKYDIEGQNGVIYLVDTVLDVPEGTVYQILEKYNLTTFKNAVDRIRYTRTLNTTSSSQTSRYTLFVPSEAAFAKLDPSQLNHILQSSNYASQLVRYHIHRGTLHLKSLDHSSRISTLYTGHTLAVDVNNQDIRMNHIARMLQSDIEADNGVVHIIDHVLIPSTLSQVIIG